MLKEMGFLQNCMFTQEHMLNRCWVLSCPLIIIYLPTRVLFSLAFSHYADVLRDFFCWMFWSICLTHNCCSDIPELVGIGICSIRSCVSMSIARIGCHSPALWSSLPLQLLDAQPVTWVLDFALHVLTIKCSSGVMTTNRLSGAAVMLWQQ